VSNEIACREVLELITSYLDRALPAEVHRAVEAHLAGCDGCTTVLEEFRQTIAMTGRLSDEQLSPAQRDILLAAFRGWATA
jgi:anti-sigma factor RsiW